MKDLSITEFRRQCLSLIDNLPSEGILIKKRGTPVAQIVPIPHKREGQRVKLPLLKGEGQLGSLCPNAETPSFLIDINVWQANTPPPLPGKPRRSGTSVLPVHNARVLAAAHKSAGYGRQ